MNIIEEIQITKFRSIGESEKFKTKKLNIFSGSNDSGKSNYLKALNLFFNNQTEIDTRYNPENDFNKWFRDNNIRGQRNIIITIKFAKGNYQDRDGINKGFTAEKIFRIDGGFDYNYYYNNGEKIEQDSLSSRKANSLISEKIRFLYIPAIRDVEFRKSLQRQIEEIANSTDDRFKTKDLKDAFSNMEAGVNNQLQELTKAIKSTMNINIQTNVNFSTLLESLTFDTNDNIIIRKKGKKIEIQNVTLNNRGDGIQMQFFSFLLWFISKNDTKHKYIWGYEEPEIAFEFKRQFELLHLFVNDFTKVAQIFLTTHSPAFALSNDNQSTNVFRVSYEKEIHSKSERYVSKLKNINVYYSDLFIELDKATDKSKLERDIWGINAQIISNMIGDSFNDVVGIRHITDQELSNIKSSLIEAKKERDQLEIEAESVKKQLGEIYPANIFICEDKNSVELWKEILITKRYIDCENFEILSSKGCTNSDIEVAILHLMKTRPAYKPKIFRQLDRDGYTSEQIDMIKKVKESNEKFGRFGKYKVGFLNVNELENYAILSDPFFTLEELKKNEERYEKLAGQFFITAKKNTQAAQRLFDSEADKKKFRDVEEKMREEARINLIKYYPGKDISKFKNRFNPDKTLKNLAVEKYPSELLIYLDEIKHFFD